MPEGGEPKARAFYSGVLGMEEIPKPTSIAGRGGCWFRSGQAELHLGVETPFAPARKAHPALATDDLAAMRKLCEDAGIETQDAVDLPARQRFFVADPFGNRIEILQHNR